MVSEFLRELVAQRADYRCEYCRSPEFVNADRFTVDHIYPRSLGGSDDLDNLALACRRCNERRYNFTIGIDPETGQEIALFNPRQQQWTEHFEWSPDGLRIQGKTPIGRATCDRLDLNDDNHANGFIQTSRQFWIRIGIHPPQ